MKFQVDKDSPPESKMKSKWKLVGDTNLEHINLREFKKRMYGLDRNGIVQAAGFLPVMQCTELVVGCSKHYNPINREIVAPDGRVLANISEFAIREAFNIPEYHNPVYMTKEEATQLYQDNV